MAKSIARNLADVASPTGVLDGTLSTAAQTNVTSLGTLSSIVIADGGNIGAASDTDAISISSGGVVTMNQIPVLSAGLNVSGGTIAGTLSTAAQGNITSLGTLTALTVDDITINGSTISDGATIAIDSGGNIELDADGGQVIFADGGTNIGRLENSSSDFVIKSMVNDKDIIFKGEDGGSPVTALTLSMSGAGAATFNSTVTATTFIGALTGNVTGNVSGTAATVTGAAQTNITSVGTLTGLDTTGDITVTKSSARVRAIESGGATTQIASGGSTGYVGTYSNDPLQILSNSTAALTFNTSQRADFSNDIGLVDGRALRLGTNDDTSIYNDGSNLYIKNNTSNQDIIFQGNDDGSTGFQMLKLDASNAGTALFGGQILTPTTGLIGTVSSAGTLTIIGGATNPGGKIELSGGNNTGTGDAGIKFYAQASTATPAERMRITSAGNVNIGAKDYHTHNSTVDSLQIGYALNLYEDSYNTGTLNYAVWANNSYYSTSGGNKYMRNDEASRIMQYDGNLSFQNAASGTADNAVTFADRFFIKADGSVGIGTTNPTRKLHIVSTGSATYSGSSAGSNIALHLANLESGAAGRTIGIGMSSESNAEVYLNCVTSSNNNGGDFVIASRNGGTRAEKLRVNADGRLEMPVVDLITPSYNHFRGAANGVNSIGGGAVSHGRMRQYTFQQSMNANTTVALLQNQSAHTDVHIQYWIECFHSSRTYRIGHAVWGGYGLYTNSAGHGLDLTITAVSSGIKRLDFAAAGVTTVAYICMWVYGDSGITVHNGTLADQI